MLLSCCLLHFIFFIIAQCEIPYLNTVEIDTNALKSFLKNMTKESCLASMVVSNKKEINMKKFYQEMFENVNVSIKTCNFDNIVEIIRSNDCILLFDSLHGIENILNEYKSAFWSTGYFYVLRSINETDFSLSNEILDVNFQTALERLWKLRKIYKVVISIGDRYVYYDPFEFSGTKVVANEIERERNVLEKDSNRLGALRISTELNISTFVRRRDFNGHKLIVSTFEYFTMAKNGEGHVGSDGKVMKEICKMMNVTPTYRYVNESTGGTANDIFTNTLQQLINHTSDVGFNGFFIKDYDVRSIEFTEYVMSDSICVVVPKSGAIPNYLAIVSVFSVETWILLIISHIVISIIYLRNKMVFAKLKKREFLRILRNTGYSHLILENDESMKKSSKSVETFRETYEYEVMGFFDAHVDMKFTQNNKRTGDQRNMDKWNLSKIYDSLKRKNQKKPFDTIFSMRHTSQFYLNHSTPFIYKVLLFSIQPLKMIGNRLSERVVLACSLLLGVVLGGSFTSQLASSYSKPAFYKNIETLKELEESGMPILTNFQNLRNDVFANDNTSILSNLQVKLQFANTTEMRYKALVLRKAGVLERKKFLPFSIFGNHQMHVVNECPKQYNLAFVVVKGSVFLPRINEIIGRFQNGGLYEKWFKDMKPNIEKVFTTKLVVIRVNHLYLPFAILLLGLSCGIIIFFCERKGYV